MRQILVVDDQIPLISDLVQGCEVIRAAASEISNGLLKKHHATALIVRSTTTVSDELLHGTNVSFVGSATAGMDHIEYDLLCDRNIRVVGAPGCNANAVAEYVMIWLDALNIDTSRTLGIIGFGNVGQRLARYAIKRGHHVYVNDPPLADIGYQFPEHVHHVQIEQLLTNSSIVSLHTPMIKEGAYKTHHLINRDKCALLPKDALLINSARGGIVEESALVDRITEGSLSCVLDVFEGEPMLLRETIDAVAHCTPHIAGYSQTAKYQGALIVLKAFRAHTGIAFDIPEVSEIQASTATSADDASIVTNHPFRDAWMSNPTPQTFENCRRLTPLRNEHMQPPTWEELHGHHT